MSKATFIISFDCEGKWGMVDLSQNNSQLFSNERLNNAYSDIISIMKHYNIKGTFGFVGAFTMTQEEYFNNTHLFNELIINNKPYLKSFLIDAENKIFDGWMNPKTLDIVRTNKNHEIASHGFSHLPLSESIIDQKTFLDEMSKMKKIMESKNIRIKTLIYPRNKVGFTSELSQFGIKGYREDFFGSNSPLFGKTKSFMSEFNIFQKAQKHSKYQNPIKIPSGYFLNWRSHYREKIPVSITTKRWENIVKNAIQNNSVIHLWTHPHNFITGKNQFMLFEKILKIVSEARNQNKLNIMTQNEYCLSILNENKVY